MEIVIQLGFLVSIISFLVGLKFMSSPRLAQKGNLIAGGGMVLAMGLTVISALSWGFPEKNLVITTLAVFAGGIVGKRIESNIEMTGMPQLISLFNATGGACAVLIGVVEARQGTLSNFAQLCLILGVVTGSIAATGSLMAYGKLAGHRLKIEKISTTIFNKPVLFLLLLLPTLYFMAPNLLPSGYLLSLIIFFSLLYGILFVSPIGGADMPVVISFLNSITGLSTAFAGLIYDSKIMIVGGIIVGAAGTFLTIMMCKAMNKSLWKIFATKPTKSLEGDSKDREQIIQQISTAELALEVSHSRKIAVVPGYGLAVAQAQHVCKQLQDFTEKEEIELNFIIHPVAGRMPGHMNVLLAEADIDYGYFKEMDEVNDQMDSFDLCLVIGANDVVNPAAENDDQSQIYGMPVIRAHHSKKVVVLKRSMNSGYAGVQNSLFEQENCYILFGDAKHTLSQTLDHLKMFSID